MKKSARDRLREQGFRGETKPTAAQKNAWALAFAARHNIPRGQAMQLLKTNDTQATSADIATALTEWAEALPRRK